MSVQEAQEVQDPRPVTYRYDELHILPNEKDCPADCDMYPGELYLDKGGSPEKSRICCPNRACGQCASLAKHTIDKSGPYDLDITLSPSLECPHCEFHYWVKESKVVV